jgi:hypothetical protein
MSERDVRPFGEDRMIFQQRPEAGQIERIDVIDPENRVRISNVDDRR